MCLSAQHGRHSVAIGLLYLSVYMYSTIMTLYVHEVLYACLCRYICRFTFQKDLL